MVEQFRTELLNLKARLANLYIYNTELGITDSVLQHNLIILQRLSNVLISYEESDEDIPYQGQSNRLTSIEYREMLQVCNMILDTIINYNFTE